MHLILIEDSKPDQEKLEKLIQKDCCVHGQTAELSFYESGESFLEEYCAGGCDALFIDIMMDGISGITVAKKVRETEPRLPIIFTTIEPDFALEGYSVHAMDYLVKPLDPAKVSWCLKELREYLATPVFLTLSENDGRGHSHPRTVTLDSILYGQYRKHNMEIHTSSDIFYSRLSFQKFNKLLPHSGRFFVCTRGLVVNLSHVEQVNTEDLLLSNGEKLPLTRGRSQQARDAFSSWMFSRSRKGGWA